ncbi:MAG: glycosyltransferase [Candidatus Eremiobacteraeota bacterium]|nr:glycosyltransferase [Candidatus Eremiobacteraeota bacterium]
MIKDFASVVLCTYNRAHLLKRSLKCYARQTEKRFELIILDDGSSDDTEALVKSFSGQLKISYVKLDDKKPGEWRDAGAIVNRGIMKSRGEFVYIAHPEVMICFDCIEKANRTLRAHPDHYFNSRTYYLTFSMQEKIDSVDWENDFYAIRNIEGFYDNKEPLYKEEYLGMVINPYSTPSFAETCDEWESWIFGGMLRTKWKEFGGLNESDHWGTVDFDFIQRRRLLNWVTNSPKDIFVIHQNHDKAEGQFQPTVRDFDSMLKDTVKQFGRKRNFLKDMEL